MPNVQPIAQYLVALARLLALVCLGGLFTVACRAESAVIIAVNEDILPDYHRFLNNRDPASIQDYKGDGARRDVIELVLLTQALKLGGFTGSIQLKPEQSYLRTLRDIADGRFITSAGLVWKSDIDHLADKLLVSRPLIKQGQFIVGLYTTPHNVKALQARTEAQLHSLKPVTNSQWKSDVETLKQMGFANLIFSPNWVNMVRMIEADRADFTLAPFQSTPDKSIQVGDVKLLPIQGIKVAIDGSRHWPISRKHPQGQAFYEALERGIAILEAKGRINKAYTDCGFFHPDLADWRLLKTQP